MEVTVMQHGFYMDESMEYSCIYVLSLIILASGIILLAMQTLGVGIQHGYGRYGDRLSSCCGQIDSRLGWFIQECPCLIIPILLWIFTRNTQLFYYPNIILITLFIVHYIQRIFIFSLCIRGGKSTPILPVLVAFLFCCINGYIQIRTHAHFYHYGNEIHPHFIIGLVLFVSGMFINIQSDSILRNLRKPGEQGYKIPRGGLFEYVSGANFFGESLEWFGFAVSSWSFTAAVFSVFTMCYIGTRACTHHRYYLKKFENYPKNRKAFIPFLI